MTLKLGQMGHDPSTRLATRLLRELTQSAATNQSGNGLSAHFFHHLTPEYWAITILRAHVRYASLAILVPILQPFAGSLDDMGR